MVYKFCSKQSSQGLKRALQIYINYPLEKEMDETYKEE